MKLVLMSNALRKEELKQYFYNSLGCKTKDKPRLFLAFTKKK